MLNSIYIKDFKSWNAVKMRLNAEERKVNIRAGEVRWIAFGVNVGSEIDGKGVSFTRPGLIMSVIGSHLAFVIPMSTKIKDAAGYVETEFKGEQIALCVHQTRVISQKRIFSRIGRISEKRLRETQLKLRDFFMF